MKILIVQTAFLGDVILATSFVAEVAAEFPQADIQFLLRSEAAPLLEGNPHLTKVWKWEKSRSKITDLWQTIKRIRKARFDKVFHIQRFGSAGLITILSGAEERVGYSSNPFSFGFSRKVKHQIPHKWRQGYLHETQRTRLLLDPEIKADTLPPKLYPKPADVSNAVNLINGQPAIVIAPDSQWFTKKWPAEKWAELIALIPEWIKVFLVGGSDAELICESLAAGKSNVKNLAGKLSLLQSAALIKEAIRLFSNDSGPMHMASAMDTPVTGVFLATYPELGFTPTSKGSRVVKAEVACCSTGIHGAMYCKAGDFHCASQLNAVQVAGPELELWRAAEVLRNNGVLLHDTDTIPGLGVRATDPAAVDKVYHIKERDRNRPLLVLCADLEMAAQYVNFIPEQAREIFEMADQFPVTIVLPGARNLAVNMLPENGTAGIRIPANPEIRKLIKYVGEPIASTSANLSGNPVSISLDGVDPLIRAQADLVWSPEVKSDLFDSSSVIIWNGKNFDLVREGPHVEKLARWLS